MKTKASDISVQALLALLNQHYELSVDHLTFLPEGEDAYNFIAWHDLKASALVRLQPTQRAGLHDRAYQAIHQLQHQGQLDFIVAPLQTIKAELSVPYEDYTVAVFPHIEGQSAYPQGLDTEALERTALHLAQLHCYADSSLELERENFSNPFAKPIHAVLDFLATGPQLNPLQASAQKLLHEQQDDIATCCKQMEAWQAQFLQRDLAYLLSHGDPNLANIMVNRQGIFLIDWGDIKFAPCERDLFFFSGDSFQRFMQAYWQWHQPQLDTEIFRFYTYRWSMQEIADYSTRLFFEAASPTETQHAWQELQDYLPLRHDQIDAEMHRIQAVIEAL